jgi:hypothetical protein
MQASNLKVRIAKVNLRSFNDGYSIGGNMKLCFMAQRNTKLVNSTMFFFVHLWFYGLIDNYL